jgi:hypothetical protein
MPTLTASRLVELLAQIMEEKGARVYVAVPLNSTSGIYVSAKRCWWNEERKCICIDYE